jgi:hypothetical protein
VRGHCVWSCIIVTIHSEHSVKHSRRQQKRPNISSLLFAHLGIIRQKKEGCAHYVPTVHIGPLRKRSVFVHSTALTRRRRSSAARLSPQPTTNVRGG